MIVYIKYFGANFGHMRRHTDHPSGIEPNGNVPVPVPFVVYNFAVLWLERKLGLLVGRITPQKNYLLV